MFGANLVSGTTIKFEPVRGSDQMLVGGVPKPISTKMMCIVSMKEYDQGKSLEVRLSIPSVLRD